MAPLILTLAVLSASCALTTALALCWGRRQARHPGTLPVTLFADDPALGIRLYVVRKAAERRQAQRMRRRIHPLRVRHIRIRGWSLMQWAQAAASAALLLIILVCLAFA